MNSLKRVLPALLILTLSAGCAGLGSVDTAKPAPEFSVKLITGEDVSLANYKGRPLVLNVAASWCPHCLHELPTFKKAYDKHKDKAEFLMVFVKSPKEDVDNLVIKHELKFPVGLDPDAKVGKAFGVRGIPVTFFITSGGVVKDDYFGAIEEDALSRKIDALTREPGP